ncbi:MAG: hypothetical protein L6Q78_12000 [Bacteroidia bacterium]|nr:hypothetical protein [Bacteroidia bacterium]
MVKLKHEEVKKHEGDSWFKHQFMVFSEYCWSKDSGWNASFPSFLHGKINTGRSE